MRFNSLGTAAVIGAALVNPGMLVAAGVAYAAGKWASEEYRSEVRACDALLKDEFEGDPDDSASRDAADMTASIMDTLAIPTCGLSALILHNETRKMRYLRESAMNSLRRMPRQTGLRKRQASY